MRKRSVYAPKLRLPSPAPSSRPHRVRRIYPRLPSSGALFIRVLNAQPLFI